MGAVIKFAVVVSTLFSAAELGLLAKKHQVPQRVGEFSKKFWYKVKRRVSYVKEKGYVKSS